MRYSSWLGRHLVNLRRIEAGETPGWPFTALGRFEGLIVLRSAGGKVSALPAIRLTRARMLALFEGDAALLRRLFPSAGGHGWCFEHAAEAVMIASYAAGIIDPAHLDLLPIYRRPRGGTPTVVLVPRPRSIAISL